MSVQRDIMQKQLSSVQQWLEFRHLLISWGLVGPQGTLVSEAPRSPTKPHEAPVKYCKYLIYIYNILKYSGAYWGLVFKSLLQKTCFLLFSGLCDITTVQKLGKLEKKVLLSVNQIFAEPHEAPSPSDFLSRYKLPPLFGWTPKDLLPLKVSLFVSIDVVAGYMPLEDFMRYEYFRHRVFFRGERYLACWPGRGEFENPGDRRKPRGAYFIQSPWSVNPIAKCIDFGPDWPEYMP